MAFIFIWVDELWGSIYEKYPPGLIEFGCMVFTQVVGFWIPGTIYLGIDLLFPNFSNRHKIQSERRQPSRAQIIHCIRHVGLNEIVGLSIQLALRTAFGFQYSVFRVERQLPGLWTVVSDIVYGSLAREFVFYYIHRAFHHPLMYTKVHKQHQQFTAPISFAGQYAHPVEHIFANLVPVIVPLALRGANLVSATIFVLYEIWQAAADHSGYDFVKLPPTKFHDLHHEKFRVYFGTIGLMDWLHGTDKVGWDKPNKAKVDDE
jgi:sterol desaturase/sphingolipid hydroxylase (fatty acid hydroxylase superfamily)